MSAVLSVRPLGFVWEPVEGELLVLGWPRPSSGPVHARDEGRFARHADGREERLPKT
ncbi:MAG: hypothetical protein H0V89_00320 [Deltaproteobacteria bacterium]|nr:hypothetical protein [Deltaproteobacteria bacterium]